jgi:hypothetical protein
MKRRNAMKKTKARVRRQREAHAQRARFAERTANAVDKKVEAFYAALLALA